ncbi:glycosyltransferase family 2 protein [Confluentibacter sediminis]|uniref:glycosyltransferase family 2 protein n=1 Tax=Confluentibacter sediminis TaxID=2219045 RepID=UPI000DAC3F93|nr:glycosyltransferase [Confluentibacter sediminis]
MQLEKERYIKVTVGIMSYNNADFIIEAIESVLKQTYNNWELFIVDDGSKDNTQDIISQYLNDSRIKYIGHEVNKGQAATWEHVLSLGEGDIIGTLHADDYWDENMLNEVVSSFAEDSGLDLFYTNWTFIGSNNTGPVVNKFGSGLDFLKYEIKQYTILPSASFLSRSVIKKSPSPICNYRAAVDTYYFYRVLLKANKVKSSHLALTNYRLHDNNETTVSRATGYVFEECIDNLKNIKKEEKISNLSNLIDKRIADAFLILGIQRIKFGDSTNTWHYIGSAFKSSSLSCIRNSNFYRLLFYHAKTLVSN